MRPKGKKEARRDRREWAARSDGRKTLGMLRQRERDNRPPNQRRPLIERRSPWEYSGLPDSEWRAGIR